jgi:hypothetical protein
MITNMNNRMVKTEPDWAEKVANRIIKGYRVQGLKGREIRDKIARALHNERDAATKTQFGANE